MHKTKVFAYLVRNGRELLVNRHFDFPEAGIQVPAGTVEPEESLEAALWREVEEETGLTPAMFKPCVITLGERHVLRELPSQTQWHHRHFFRLDVDDGVVLEDRWQHVEMYCDDGSEPVRLEHVWCELSRAREILWPGFGALLDAL